MENSSCDQTYNAGDLIWILRGDRMWWPAQVLSPNEFCKGSAGSRKAIKLLGQDYVNESLDWFALDKVEPFRSVEFIFLIALATLPSACRPSSARDAAIREALDIERVQQLRAESNSSGAINSDNNKEERVQHSFDLNIEYVPSDNEDDHMPPLIEEPNDIINKQEGHEKRQRRRRRAKELDNLLAGVGIELTTSNKRKRKLLPHAREFLESCRNRRRRASNKKLKAVSNHDSSSNEELKSDTLSLLNERSSQGGAASHKRGSTSSHVETLINQNHESETMRERADEIRWNWNVRVRTIILRARRKSQACVPVNTVFNRLLKDLDE